MGPVYRLELGSGSLGPGGVVFARFIRALYPRPTPCQPIGLFGGIVAA